MTETGWTPGYLPANGTDGEIFRSRHCAGCIHEDDATDKWCPILTYAMGGVPQPEWQHGPIQADRSRPTRCTARTPRDEEAR